MKHPLFDPDQPLTEELWAHLRNCPSCAALWQVDQLLRSTPPVPPPAGFMERFQARLMEERQAPQAPRPWQIALPMLLLLLSLGASRIIPPLNAFQLFLSIFHAVALALQRLLLLARTILLLFQTAYTYLPPQFWLPLLAGNAVLLLIWFFSLRRAQLFWIQVNR